MPCWIDVCGVEPVVQWQRRSADDPASTVAVFSCGPHAITLDAAAHVHRAACVPSVGSLPACGCTPEPLPVSAPPTSDVVTLPTGWTVPVS